MPNSPSSLSLSDVVLAGAPGSLSLNLVLKELPARGDRAGCRHPGAIEQELCWRGWGQVGKGRGWGGEGHEDGILEEGTLVQGL